MITVGFSLTIPFMLRNMIHFIEDDMFCYIVVISLSKIVPFKKIAINRNGDTLRVAFELFITPNTRDITLRETS